MARCYRCDSHIVATPGEWCVRCRRLYLPRDSPQSPTMLTPSAPSTLLHLPTIYPPSMCWVAYISGGHGVVGRPSERHCWWCGLGLVGGDGSKSLWCSVSCRAAAIDGDAASSLVYSEWWHNVRDQRLLLVKTNVETTQGSIATNIRHVHLHGWATANQCLSCGTDRGDSSFEHPGRCEITGTLLDGRSIWQFITGWAAEQKRRGST